MGQIVSFDISARIEKCHTLYSIAQVHFLTVSMVWYPILIYITNLSTVALSYLFHCGPKYSIK